MNDDWTEVGEVTDGSGKRLVIAWAEDKVRFAVKAPIRSGLHLTTIVLDGPARDRFMRLVADAERQAEGHPCCIHCAGLHAPGVPHPGPCASCDAGY